MDTKEKKILFEQAVSDFNQYVAAYHDDEPYFVTEARSGRAMIEGDFEQAYTYAHLLWHKYTMMYHYGNYTKETDYVFYGRALHTVITAGILSGRKNNLFSIIGYAFIGYERFPGTNENQYYYPVCMYGYLIACYEKGDATELNIVLKKIEGLPLWNQDHPDMMLYRTLGTWLGIVYHALHEYKASLQWIKTVIASNHKDTTCIHYVEFCKLFEFIVEYELLGKKINTSFKLSVESAYEQLRKHPEKERACTAILLLFFKHLAECKREQKRQDVILKLKKDIAQMKDTFAARYFNSLFDFGNWVEQLTSTVRIKAA